LILNKPSSNRLLPTRRYICHEFTPVHMDGNSQLVDFDEYPVIELDLGTRNFFL